MKSVFSVVLILFAASVAFTQPEWLVKMKKIRLLSHTYEDVVGILDRKPVDRGRGQDTIELFDFPEGQLWVRFQSNSCERGEKSGWKVPKWTVIDLHFGLEPHVKPGKLGLTSKGFLATPVHDDPAIEYVNDKLGMTYVVKQGNVQSLTFRPSRKFDKLRCNSR